MMARLLVLLAVLAGAAAKHMLNVAEHGVCAAVNRSRACQIDSDGDGVVPQKGSSGSRNQRW